ncbi:RHS repeat-associated core domain-containing protein [Pseudomonas shirazica]|jgi:RHS repeat-associated protein|uniref:RHS repeat-associated core domain-containing protein n=1 Tax=Pseudomonas TaxID=286 RepID=UPI0009B681A2|nr:MULTISPECIES: RHS repeat-associated core domain-containing protein [Pseudomonas]KAF4561715.1 RHS repeat-associated core domain-containing protein [Pseudomonas sp. CES]MBF8789226.1 RHS repeat-associated core domain-containing protein [Pseudomonas asiatica]MBF8802847.1 RHS repeat-associated core domain-containing protein [Pseudomonas asiatica]MBH3379549.1 RHS repeat-associated core domain-containing protein [Pseudomonas asiatica]MBO2892502.1 RHS repeat-associated core domain-containing protei
MPTSSTSKNDQGLAPQRSLHFYKSENLTTEIAAQGNRRLLWANDMALAQLDQAPSAKMLRVDLANSVLGIGSWPMAYSPYGYLATDRLEALLGFTGQRYDRVTQGNPLGAGRRFHSPGLMRLCTEDPSSPFGKGGLNSYAYCVGDPINRDDPTGESSRLLLFRAFNSFKKASVNFAINGGHGFVGKGASRKKAGFNNIANNATTITANPSTLAGTAPASTSTGSKALTIAPEKPVEPVFSNIDKIHTPAVRKPTQPSEVRVNRIIGDRRSSNMLGGIFGVLFGGIIVGLAVWAIMSNARRN